MRPQITVYLAPELKRWLTRYAKGLHLRESEVVKLLVEQEKSVGWLRWALRQSGPTDPQRGPLLVIRASLARKKPARRRPRV
jgi:hypothetical protein